MPNHVLSAAFMILLLSAGAAVGTAETVVDQSHGFTLTVPDGFVRSPDLVDAVPEIIHAYVLADGESDELRILLMIEDLGGTIGRERLKVADMPPGFSGKLFTTTWNGYEVDGIEVPEQAGDISAITYNVQIPLKGSAIQVKLFGPVAREAELKTLLTQTLEGLEGESNWEASSFPQNELSSSQNYGTFLLGLAIAIIVGGLVLLWLVSTNSARGTVLGLAVLIYLGGAVLAGFRTRELLLISGSLKLLGVAGVLLGIFDFFRKRESRGTAPANIPKGPGA